MTPYEKGFNDCKQQVKKAMVPVIEEAILMEREACAKVCEEVGDKAKDNDGYTMGGYACAAAIRARSEPSPAFKNYMGDNWAGIV